MCFFSPTFETGGSRWSTTDLIKLLILTLWSCLKNKRIVGLRRSIVSNNEPPTINSFSLSSSSSFLSFIIFNIIIMAIHQKQQYKIQKERKKNHFCPPFFFHLVPLLHFHLSSFHCKINLTSSSFEKSIKPLPLQSSSLLVFFLIQTFLKPIIINLIIKIQRIDQQISLVHYNFKRLLISN